MKNVQRLMVVLTMVLSLGMIAQSCKTSANSSSNLANLESMENKMNGTWILKSLDGQAATNLFKGKIPSLTFDFAANRIFGNGGCNSYNGGFTFDMGIFSAPNVASTMMACVHENKEHQYLEMLSKNSKVSIIQGALTFTNEGKKVAEFVRGIDQSMLIGTWILESIEGENLKALFTVQEKTPTLEFDLQENRINGNSGCNTYGASYEVEGTAIKVGLLRSTRMACPDMAGETKFTQAISETSTLDVQPKELTFSKEGKVVLRFKKK